MQESERVRYPTHEKIERDKQIAFVTETHSGVRAAVILSRHASFNGRTAAAQKIDYGILIQSSLRRPVFTYEDKVNTL